MRGQLVRGIAAFMVIVGACGGADDGGAASTTAAPPSTAAPATTASPSTTIAPTAVPTTTAAATTTAPPATTATPVSAIDVGTDGTVTIDWTALASTPFFAPPVASSSDPFFHIHSNPATDGFFLSIEAYTAYGSAWSGETGTFEIGCAPAASGICMYLDVDGPGAVPVAGSNFDATGMITIVQLDESGYEVVLEDIVFSEGYVIPGPVTLTG